MPFRFPEFYVALTLLAALLFAAGNALQKQAVASRLQPIATAALLRRGRQLFAPLVRSPIWLLGLAITIGAFAVEIQALALGDVTVVKPLSRVQILFVVAIGVGALGEKLARAEWIGVAMILAGAVFLGIEPGDARAWVPRTAVIVAVAVGVGFIASAGLWFSDRGLDRRHREHAPALAAGVFFGLGDILMKAATDVVRAGTGGFSLTSADTLTSFAVAPELVLSILATTLAFTIQQIAFSRGRVSLVVPLVGVAGTAVVVLLGASLLREQVSAARAASIAVMLAGTVLIGRGARRDARLGSALGRLAP
jgi:drug/metabolite transporter (DMT)-like permease